MNKILILTLIFLASFTSLFSEVNNTDIQIMGSAYLENKSYNFLQKLCDETGGRLPGSENNKKGLEILKSSLKALGVEPLAEEIRIPGWFRGDDEVEMISPVRRKFRAYALGYVNKTPEFTSELVWAKNGLDSDFNEINAKDKIALVTQEAPKTGEAPLRMEALANAFKAGAKAIVFISDKSGYQIMVGMTNFHGDPAPIPAYTITMEEGNWLRRLLVSGTVPLIRMKTESHCEKEIISENVVVRFPGESKKKIIIAAHFDSWDLGQGAVDNGHGTSILLDICRLIRKYSPSNYYTIECVWLNAEETGLWGSRKYNEMHKNDDIGAMINMDMTGSPTGLNAMGYEEFIPFFRDFAGSLKGFNFSADVANSPWTNSDHMYYMFSGIPSFTFNAYLDKEMYQYYHDAGDSFDKVNPRYLSDAAGIIAIFIRRMANDRTLKFERRNKQQVKDMLIKYNLDKRLKRQGEWNFD